MIFFLIGVSLFLNGKRCMSVNGVDSISTCLKIKSILCQYMVWKPFHKQFKQVKFVLNVKFKNKTLNKRFTSVS